MATNAVLHHNKPVMTAKGLFHELEVYPDRLVIRRTDLISRLFGHDEVISYDQIKSIHTYKSLFLIDNGSQLVIISYSGKSRALSYGAHQQHSAQKIKDSVENFLSHREVVSQMNMVQSH